MSHRISKGRATLFLGTSSTEVEGPGTESPRVAVIILETGHNPMFSSVQWTNIKSHKTVKRNKIQLYFTTTESHDTMFNERREKTCSVSHAVDAKYLCHDLCNRRFCLLACFF